MVDLTGSHLLLGLILGENSDLNIGYGFSLF